MPNTQKMETAPTAAPEQDHHSDARPSPSRHAAAIEAAYILEAVRK